jgi:hypothetical protein
MTKEWSSLARKEMQIKTMFRFHITPLRVATIKNTNNNKCWLGCGEEGTNLHSSKCKLIQLLWKTLWRGVKKLKIELVYNSSLLLIGIYPKGCKSGYIKGTCTPVFIEAIFTIPKILKQQNVPLLMNGWRKCNIFTQWNFIQPQRRMKYCNFQVNG